MTECDTLGRKGIKLLNIMNHVNKMENRKHVNILIDTLKVLH